MRRTRCDTWGPIGLTIPQWMDSFLTCSPGPHACQDVYEVHHILDSRPAADSSGQHEYLIKWKGWGNQVHQHRTHSPNTLQPPFPPPSINRCLRPSSSTRGCSRSGTRGSRGAISWTRRCLQRSRLGTPERQAR